jgi:uncharacterized damage-inducible protein DinB
MPSSEEKAILHDYLQQSRDGMFAAVDGLSEFDMRRPMTPTGTNLLGLVKHLAGLEYGYLGRCFGRTPAEKMPWEEDGSIWDGADMWATADESSEYLIGLYRRAIAHADQTIAELSLDAIGTVPWWPEGDRDATLRHLVVRMTAETARHAGHADILRETIDGNVGREASAVNAEEWPDYVQRIQDAADRFAP